MFAGINMFWARLKLILARAVRRGLKCALRRFQNIFMPKNISSILIIFLEGTEELNNEKVTTKHSEESAVRKRQQTLQWLLDFDWLLRSYDYFILTFYWFISAS